ncbi:MAG TPA: GIY-YIG nuclease family protein [Rhodospirillales bacterium]|nr:GIY-YIG nuclease family protein [Rhodospirillales bacterium]
MTNKYDISSVAAAEDLPAGPGSYALIVAVLRPMAVPFPGKGRAILPEGYYLYAGSAKGPGGIRARTRRHLKGAKPIHWHVDRLTNANGVAMVLAFPGGAECGLLERVANWPGVSFPAPGFGSTDCRSCPSHLVKLAEGFAVDGLDSNEPGGPVLVGDMTEGGGGNEAVIWRAPPVRCFWSPPASS